MKASLLMLTFLTISTTAQAHEKLFVGNGYTEVASQMYSQNNYADGDILTNNEREMKIATLTKLLDQQQRLYEEKINYLEDELKKSKERLVEKSINHDKIQTLQERTFNEESTFLKKELVSKTKTLMEYQRQLEKLKPSEEVKGLINANTDLALELRKTTDQIALMELKGDTLAKKPLEGFESQGRMPASAKDK